MAESHEDGQMINVGNMPLPQLQQIKQQLDQEIEFLTSSFRQLKTASKKFSEAQESIKASEVADVGKQLLVPVSSSVYVAGTLQSPKKFLVDIGTGYFVEKEAADALEYFKRRQAHVDKNAGNVENTIIAKRQSLATLNDVIRQRMAQMVQQQTAVAAK